MIIYTVCKNCQQKIKIRGNYLTQEEIAMDKGKTIELICSSCKRENIYEIDSIRAEKDKRDVLLLILLFPLLMLILWFLYPFATAGIITLFILPVGIGIPVSLYGIIVQNEIKRVKLFNKSMNINHNYRKLKT